MKFCKPLSMINMKIPEQTTPFLTSKSCSSVGQERKKTYFPYSFCCSYMADVYPHPTLILYSDKLNTSQSIYLNDRQSGLLFKLNNCKKRYIGISTHVIFHVIDGLIEQTITVQQTFNLNYIKQNTVCCFEGFWEGWE